MPLIRKIEPAIETAIESKPAGPDTSISPNGRDSRGYKEVNRQKHIEATLRKYKNSQRILDNEKGNRFYHRALSPKARSAKKAQRKQARASRKRNRGNR